VAAVTPDFVYELNLGGTWDATDVGTTDVTTNLTDSNPTTFSTLNPTTPIDGIRVDFTGLADLQSGDTISIDIESLGSWGSDLALLPYNASTGVTTTNKVTLTPVSLSTNIFTLTTSFITDLFDQGSDQFSVRVVQDLSLTDNGLEISEVTSNLTVYVGGNLDLSGEGDTVFTGTASSPSTTQSLTGPIPHPLSSTLTIPSTIKFDDKPLTLQFDLSNVGDTATPKEDWGVIVKLIGNYGSRTTVHIFEYIIPGKTVVIDPSGVFTFKGTFHPLMTHKSIINSVTVNEGIPLVPGQYSYNIIANRNIDEIPYFNQEINTYYLNNMYLEGNFQTISIIGDPKEFKKAYDKNIAKCHTAISIKPDPPIRKRFLKCSRIGAGSIPTSVTKPGTIPTLPTISSSSETQTTSSRTFTTPTTPTTPTDPTVTQTTTFDTIPPITPPSTPTDTFPPVLVPPVGKFPGLTTTTFPPVFTLPTIPKSPTTPTTPTIPTIKTLGTLPRNVFTLPTVPTIKTTETTTKRPTVFTLPTLRTLPTVFTLPIFPRSIFTLPTIPTTETSRPTTPTNPSIPTLGTQPTLPRNVFTLNTIPTTKKSTPTIPTLVSIPTLVTLPRSVFTLPTIPTIETTTTTKNNQVIFDKTGTFKTKPVIITDYKLIGKAIRFPGGKAKPKTEFKVVPIVDKKLGDVVDPRKTFPTDLSVPTFNTDKTIETSTTIRTSPPIVVEKISPVLKFTQLDKGSLGGTTFKTESPITNYWETIDPYPPIGNKPIKPKTEIKKVSNLPKYYPPFLKKTPVDVLIEDITKVIKIPALGVISPGSVKQKTSFRPFLDRYGIPYPGGYPLSVSLVNSLVAYYTATKQTTYLKKIEENIVIEEDNGEEAKARFFNTLAGPGLIWPQEIPDWYIPWMQKTSDTTAGNFVILNPRLYQAASRLFSFNQNMTLTVSTPKNFQAELKYNRDLGIPEKIVAVIKSNSTKNIQAYKTSDVYVDTTVSKYETIIDIDELSSKFQAPAEVIYIYYNDPILRLLLYQSAEITMVRDQFSMKSFGDNQLIYTIPKCIIIIPTDDPARCSLRGSGSKATSFGTRSITLTQSTVPSDWDGPNKPVMEVIGTYKDVWGMKQFHQSELNSDDFRYPEGTFKLVFSDTKRDTGDWMNYGSTKNNPLEKTVFEKYKEAQDILLEKGSERIPTFDEVLAK